MAFLGLLSVALLSCDNNKKELKKMQTGMDSLTHRLEVQRQKNDSLENLMQQGNTEKDIQVYFSKAFDTIGDPEAYITRALKENKEKIPIKAVLGGNMEFRQVKVLTEDWVLAIYDDGHVQGKSIFKYELQPDGNIRFTELISEDH